MLETNLERHWSGGLEPAENRTKPDCNVMVDAHIIRIGVFDGGNGGIIQITESQADHIIGMLQEAKQRARAWKNAPASQR